MNQEKTIYECQELATKILNVKEHNFFTQSSKIFLTALIHSKKGDYSKIKREDINLEKLINKEEYKELLFPFTEAYSKGAYVQIKSMLNPLTSLLERNNLIDDKYLDSIGVKIN